MARRRIGLIAALSRVLKRSREVVPESEYRPLSPEERAEVVERAFGAGDKDADENPAGSES